jgi:hypothetical protein
MEFTAVSAKSDQSWADRMDELNSPTSVVTEVMFPVSEPAPVWTPEPGPMQIPENSNHLTKSEKSYSSGYPHGAIHTRQHPDSISHTRPTRGSLGVARILKSSLRKSVVPDHIRRRDQQALSRGSSNRLSPVEKSVIQPFSENWEEEVKQVHTSTSATPQVDAQPRPDMVKVNLCLVLCLIPSCPLSYPVLSTVLSRLVLCLIVSCLQSCPCLVLRLIIPSYPVLSSVLSRLVLCLIPSCPLSYPILTVLSRLVLCLIVSCLQSCPCLVLRLIIPSYPQSCPCLTYLLLCPLLACLVLVLSSVQFPLCFGWYY